MSSFLQDNFQFVNYGVEHGITIGIWVIIALILIIYSSKHLQNKAQRNVLIILGLITALSQLMKVIIRLYLGVFDYTIDLPLHLCNILPFIVPLAIVSKKRFVWAICFFWIMAGTFQALISPTLLHSFPHYEYHRYWNVHCGLVIIALYPIFVWKWRVFVTDLLFSMIGLNILGLIMYGIDIWIDANYMYMRAWPPGKTIYNFLGEWPIYHYKIEGLMVVLFGLLWLPFGIRGRIQQSRRM